MIPKCEGRAGLTVIEMLTAIGILVVFMAGVYRVIHFGSDIAGRGRIHVDTSRRTLQNLAWIGSDLRSTSSGGWRGYIEGGGAESGDITAGYLRIVSLQSQYEGAERRYSVVEYRLLREEAGFRRGIYRRTFEGAKVPESEGDRQDWELINEYARGLDFSFLDENGRWQPSRDSSGLPAAVKIRIRTGESAFYTAEEPAEFRTVVNIPEKTGVLFR